LTGGRRGWMLAVATDEVPGGQDQSRTDVSNPSGKRSGASLVIDIGQAIRSESDTGLNAAITSNGAPIAGTGPIGSVSPDSASPLRALQAPNVSLMPVSRDQRHPRSSRGVGMHLFR